MHPAAAAQSIEILRVVATMLLPSFCSADTESVIDAFFFVWFFVSKTNKFRERKTETIVSIRPLDF
jgi:hypothetical protein